MPEERGSIYKSTANEIGEALKAKLGGEGFAPKDWSDNLNLLGIASEDTEAAINSLKESEGSGERGSILLSTANAIGSMLNKKYNSQRGFSPAEWASATRKMKALETDTKSGGIVNLKGAKEVPITSLVGIISPTLEGVDSLTATRLGKNLIDDSKKLFLSQNIIIGRTSGNRDDFCLRLKAGTYTFSVTTADGTPPSLYVKNSDTNTMISGFPAYNKYSQAFTLDEDTNLAVFVYKQGYTSVNDISTAQIEVGSEATAYTPYVDPTTYTANLGRTIYGGSADIVKGDGVDENGDTFTFDPIPINTSGDTENFYTSNGDTSITYYGEPTPYTRGSASGMIASIAEANTEFPFTKLKATIAPSVEGKDTVEVYNYGKNIIYPKYEGRTNAGITYTVNEDHSITCQGVANATSWAATNLSTQPDKMMLLKAGTYFLTGGVSSTIRLYLSGIGVDGSSFYSVYDSGSGALYTLTKDYYVYPQIRIDSGVDLTEPLTINIQLEVGSSASSYEPYKQPTTYTAELGETVFGGSVDLVSGEVIGNEGKIVLDNSGWTYYPVSGTNTFNKIIPFAKVGGSGILDGYNFQNVQYISQQPDKSFYFFASGTNARISIRDDSYTNANDFAAAINNKALLFELATPTESSIEPQEIYPNKGVNNIWNDANGITEVGYFGE